MEIGKIANFIPCHLTRVVTTPPDWNKNARLTKTWHLRASVAAHRRKWRDR